MPDTPPSKLIPKASPLIDWRGTPRVRRMGFVLGAKLVCPAGHTVDGLSLVLEDHTLQCRAQTGTGVHKAYCGALLYVLVMPARGDQRRRYWAADVTMDEVKLLEKLGLDADGVLSYFGVAFTREKAG